MEELVCTIHRMQLIASDVYEMILNPAGEEALAKSFETLRPGQFVNLTIDGFYLRRPISVCDVREGRLVLIFKILGVGTAVLAKLGIGAELRILGPLGNGFTIEQTAYPVLVGGGVGVPPLYYLARKMIAAGLRPKVALGFASAKDVFYEEEFKTLGLDVAVATDDGSYGSPGFVTALLKRYFNEADNLYCCGPLGMLRAVHGLGIPKGQYSFEERMGCGFGACMGCSHKMKDGGYKRVCKEGPVFRAEEIVW